MGPHFPWKDEVKGGLPLGEQIQPKFINQHYGKSNLEENILEGLRAANKNLDALTLDDLAPVDQFHLGGKEATVLLAELAGIKPGNTVLDVGGGLGGPARVLASQFKANVIVLDLTEEFCRVGEKLTALTGLTQLVKFQHGNALEMLFEREFFDLIWTQHSTMNIPDKTTLFSEIHRVLKPGGRYAFHEIMAGPVGAPHFPLPWASDPSISFLQTPVETRAELAATGFKELSWLDETAATLASSRDPVPPPSDLPSPPALGLHLVLGANFGKWIQNMFCGFQENRLTLIRGVVERA